MAWMAGSIGAILAVLLLGCTRTCRMVRASLTVGLNQANRTVRTDRGQSGEAIMAGVIVASAVSVFLGGLVMGVIAVIAIAVWL